MVAAYHPYSPSQSSFRSIRLVEEVQKKRFGWNLQDSQEHLTESGCTV